MKVDIESQKTIHGFFDEFKNESHLLLLINATNKAYYGTSDSITLQNLTYHAYHNEKKYRFFGIRKKSGELRVINAPIGGLKHIQRTLNLILQCVYKPNKVANGFVWNRSVATNAKHHVGKNYVYNMDLKDFFPSIHKARVEKRLQLPPFNLSGDKKDIATLIARLTTMKVYEYKTKVDSRTIKIDESIIYTINKKKASLVDLFKYLDFKFKEKLALPSSDKRSKKEKKYKKKIKKIIASSSIDNKILNLFQENLYLLEKFIDAIDEKSERKYAVLPQGAPTSPILSNAICDRLDRKLLRLAKKNNVKYTRYADDITFSSMHNVYRDDGEFIKFVHQTIKEENFEINHAKTRLQKRGYRQEVTGVIVNDKVNVSRRYIKKLRMMIYLLEQYDFDKAQVIFSKNYLKDRRYKVKKAPSILNVIEGKLQYLKMIKGDKDSTYQKLYQRFLSYMGEEEKDDKPEVIKEKKIDFEIAQYYECNHDPKRLVKLLGLFADHNDILKYITHTWDTGQPKLYPKYLIEVEKKWKTIQHELYEFDLDLNAKIYAFVLRDDYKEWGAGKIPIGWSSPIIKEWFEKNNQYVKSFKDIEFDKEDERLKPLIKQRLYNFQDVVDKFKSEIKFTSENNKFDTYLYKMKENKLNNFEKLDIDENSKEILESVEFFTNIEQLDRGIEDIFILFNDRSAKSKRLKIVALEDEENDSYIEVRFVHLGVHPTIPAKKLIKKLKDKKGSFTSPIKQLCSICDFSIEAQFPGKEKIQRINILKQADVPELEEDLNTNIEGFTILLRFYIK